MGVSACAPRGGGANAGPNPNARFLVDRSLDESRRVEILVRQGLLVGARTGVEVRTQFGAPPETESRPVPNAHDPSVTDSILTWRYDGVEFEIYRTADGRRLLTRAAVVDNRFLRFPEVGIGAEPARIREVLGAPLVDSREEMEYRCAGCSGPPEPVIFHLRDDRVHRVDFLFAVD
jgi:hypothetical protein